jgi:FlaA1/EpsC-like NDP-sugar epimerase
VGFIDDDRTKKGKRLQGVKILGDRHHLPILALLYNVQQIFVAIHSATTPELKAILEICHHQGLSACLFQFAVTPYQKSTRGENHFTFPISSQLSRNLRGSTVS